MARESGASGFSASGFGTIGFSESGFGVNRLGASGFGASGKLTHAKTLPREDAQEGLQVGLSRMLKA